MTVTALDPKTALILLDLQNGIAGYPLLHPIDEIATRAGTLADAFRRNGLPVVFVVADGRAPGRTEQVRPRSERPPGWTDLLPALNPQPQDHRVTKQTWGAFTGTDLQAHLKTLGVTQIVLGGVATSVAVESTARHAYELGFNVTLAIDAMTDASPEAHTHSITRIFPKLGETGTTSQIIELLTEQRSV